MMMPLVNWNDLIFPHLELDDLVSLQRTCTSFAQYERLKHWIKNGTFKAFGFFAPSHWNRFSSASSIHPSLGVGWYERQTHYLLCIMQPMRESVFNICVYSSKEQLMRMFLNWFASNKDREFLTRASSSFYAFTLEMGDIIWFCGINREISAWMK